MDSCCRKHPLPVQANPGGTNVEVLDEQASDSTAVVDEAVRVFEKREVRHSHQVPRLRQMSAWFGVSAAESTGSWGA